MGEFSYTAERLVVLCPDSILGRHALRLCEGRGVTAEAPKPRPSKTLGVPPSRDAAHRGAAESNAGDVHVRDIHATLLHQMGLNHERLSVRSQGLDVRLTGVNPAKVIKPLLA